MIESYEHLGYEVIAIINCETINAIHFNDIQLCAGIVVIENKYCDFCSWEIRIHRFANMESFKGIIHTNEVLPRDNKSLI